MSELFGALVATLITLAIFSRAWRFNPVFKAAQHLLLGVLVGYVAAVVVRQVLWPGLLAPLLTDPAGEALLLAPLLLGVLLVFRLSQRPALRSLGLIPLAVLLGAGGALALAGAARGTLFPQVFAATSLSLVPAAGRLADALVAGLSTLTTIGVLLYFQSRSPHAAPGRASRLLAPLAHWGYLALMLALGALLASGAGARITLLIDRVQFLIGLWAP